MVIKYALFPIFYSRLFTAPSPPVRSCISVSPVRENRKSGKSYPNSDKKSPGFKWRHAAVYQIKNDRKLPLDSRSVVRKHFYDRCKRFVTGRVTEGICFMAGRD